MSALNLAEFHTSVCAECGTPGWWRHLSAVGGCQTCSAEDPHPVHIFPNPGRAARGKCFQTPGGITVHVKPDCHCPR